MKDVKEPEKATKLKKVKRLLIGTTVSVASLLLGVSLPVELTDVLCSILNFC